MKVIFLAVLVLLSSVVISKDKDDISYWPREIDTKNHIITLYQPQLETLTDNNLEGRMALSIKDDKGEMIFGALWFKVRLSTDLEARTAVLEKMEIPMVKFPDIEDVKKLQQLKDIVIKDMESIDLEMSLDQILADVETVAAANNLEDQLNNKSPDIYFRNEPTVLVSIDGEPKLKEVVNSKMENVVNTPFLIVKSGNKYYLRGGDYWFISDKIVTQDWNETTKIPKDLNELAKQQIEDYKPEGETEEENVIPKVISVTTPSELVVTKGEAAYEPIPQTSLLYVTNSENDIIMDITSQQHFLLLSGRWYSSKTLKDGDWDFIEPEKLPEDFSKIPADSSSIASVRISVPGTAESQEALFEQYIPQTAVVDRKTATVEVTYDGEPKFEKIEGTTLSSAVNTESTVIKLDKKYYCVDEGIWFEADQPKGPWKVADSRPEEVDKIPPSSPAYNVKYVYIYDSTPEVVYVGYTPGYYNSYVYGGIVVYGTGFYYRPWYGSYYYPRPVTYGYGVHYNPYTGWGFSVGVSYGWLTVSAHRSYWGACGYRHGYRHGYHHGYHHGYRHGYNRGYAAGYARGKYNSNNIYKNRPSGVKQTRTNTRPSTGNTNVRPSTKPNNVYTDRNGNVMQRDKSGNWEQKNKRPAKPSQRPSTQPSTRPSQPAQRPSTQPSTRPSTQPSTRPSTQPSTRPSASPSNQMQRDYQNRNRGTSNYNNYQQNRSTPSSGSRSNYQSRPAPQRSSGGGRRR